MATFTNIGAQPAPSISPSGQFTSTLTLPPQGSSTSNPYFTAGRLWNRTYYREKVPGSPATTFAVDASQSVRTFDVDWTAQANAVEDFLGYATVVSTGAGSPYGLAVSRSTPIYHPSFYQPNGLPFLYATKCDIEGIGFTQGRWLGSIQDSNGVARYDYARMKVAHESLTYDIREDNDTLVTNLTGTGFPDEARLNRYVTKVVQPQAEYISLGYGCMRYVGGPNAGGAVPFSVGKILVSWDVALTWHGVPIEAVATQAINPGIGSNIAFIDLALGRVNDRTFAGYAAGTMLFVMANIVPHRSATGRRTYDCEYRFKFFLPGHHKILTSNNAANASGKIGFVEISSDGSAHAINPSLGDGYHVYDVAFMDTLFCPPN